MIRKETFAKAFFAKNYLAKGFIVMYLPPSFLTAKQDLFMECVVGAPVSGDNLFGRERELNHIWKRLESGDHVLMTAPRRVGKTSLMMELKRQPRPGWTVVYVDVEACDDAKTCITEIVDELSRIPKFKKHFQWTKRRESLRNFVKGLDVRAGSASVKLDSDADRSWVGYANRVMDRMREMAAENVKLLIIIDELPIAIARIAEGASGPNEATLFLSWYRKLRQNPELQRRVSTLVGGSIGLDGLVYRLDASKQINDISSFPLDSWSKTTAAQFLRQLGASEGFAIQDEYIDELLNMLEDPVPYHVQLFYSNLQHVCCDESYAISIETVRECFWKQLVDENGKELVIQLLKKLSHVFDKQDGLSAQKILDALCIKQKGVEIAALADESGNQSENVNEIVGRLIKEGDVARTNGWVRIRSGFVRESWARHHNISR